MIRFAWAAVAAAVSLAVGPQLGGARFGDVADNHPWRTEIGRAADEGWVVGYNDGTFRPDDSTSDWQWGLMIGRALPASATRGEAAAFIGAGVDYLRSRGSEAPDRRWDWQPGGPPGAGGGQDGEPLLDPPSAESLPGPASERAAAGGAVTSDCAAEPDQVRISRGGETALWVDIRWLHGGTAEGHAGAFYSIAAGHYTVTRGWQDPPPAYLPWHQGDKYEITRWKLEQADSWNDIDWAALCP